MCPGIETTWKIQPFQITSSGAESDGEGEWDQLDERPDQEGGAGGLAEISLMLAEARKVATHQVWDSRTTYQCLLQIVQRKFVVVSSLVSVRVL